MNSLLTIKEATRVSGISGQMLRHFIRTGRLKATRFGNANAIVHEDLMAFVIRYRAGDFPRGKTCRSLTKKRPLRQREKKADNQKSERKLIGNNLLWYADEPIDEAATLLGDRYLCRGGGMFIVAPSGQGKSTLAIQLAIEWAIGGSPLDIRPPGPLKSLYWLGTIAAGMLLRSLMNRFCRNVVVASRIDDSNLNPSGEASPR